MPDYIKPFKLAWHYQVLIQSSKHVLLKTPREFVVCNIDTAPERTLYSGFYTRDFSRALEEFNVRTKINSDMLEGIRASRCSGSEE